MSPRPLAAFITEISLWPVLWALARGRTVYYCGTHALVPLLAPLLARIVTLLRLSPRFVAVSNVFDDFAIIKRGVPKYTNATPLFRRSEPWLDAYFATTSFDRHFGAYAHALRHLTCTEVDNWLQQVAVVQLLREHHRDQIATIIGVPPQCRDLIAFLFEDQPPGPRRGWLHLPVNLLMLAALWLLSLGFLARLAARRRPVCPHFIGTNYINRYGCASSFCILRQIIDDDSQVCVVVHKPEQLDEIRDSIGNMEHAFSNDGALSLGQAVAALGWLSRDLARMARLSWWQPGHFRRAALLPLRRLILRGFFQVHPMRFFWTRDDYDEAHILRSQELRRVGGVIMGMTHGLSMTELTAPMWRYIDTDLYYVLGQHIYRTYYAERWPAHMVLRPVGTMMATRQQQRRLARRDSRDLVFLVNPSMNDALMMRAIVDAARALPDRRVLVQVKPGQKNRDCFPDLEERLAGLANVALTDDNTYDLIAAAGYVVSNTSTVVVEGIQFGRPTWCVDTQPPHWFNYYRELPDLCLTSGAEIALRIQALENGEASYPFAACADFITSGVDPFETVRSDLGLPMRTEAP